MKHFYPGMGATSEMYRGLWRGLEGAVFHDWPKAEGESSVSELAERLIADHRIQCGDTVAGTSLGGIIACEIANQIEVERLVLIASAVCREEISGLLKALHPLVDLAPMSFIKRAAGSLPSDLSVMFSKTDPEFIRSMCKAVFQWEGLKTKVDLLRIHGTRDRVIPLPKGVVNTVDGGHLIVMTHASECVDLIQ